MQTFGHTKHMAENPIQLCMGEVGNKRSRSASKIDTFRAPFPRRDVRLSAAKADCRGPVIAEDALVAALREQRILGAGLDVFACEPLASDHPLLDLPNALLTPHAAGITRDTWSRRAEFAFANCQRVLAGEEPLARID